MTEGRPPARGADGERFTDAQRASLGARQADQDRTLAAMHELEAALAAPAPRREGDWRVAVRGAVDVLDRATADEQTNAARADSLLSDIQRTQPHLRNRVRALRMQYDQLRAGIASLRSELTDTADIDFADLRQRLSWVLTALRHQRARESDLIYEAYYDAFRRDVEDEVGR